MRLFPVCHIHLKSHCSRPVPSVQPSRSSLRVENNKTELFAYLAEQVTNMVSSSKEVVLTYGEEVKASSQRDLSDISLCSKEEADTRIFLHAANCYKVGHRRVMIRTVDTDVIALFQRIRAEEVSVAFSTGKHTRYIAVHDILRYCKSPWTL